MYIIVVGGGEVGYYLARILISEGHEVLVLERERQRTGLISEELGDVIMRGDGCEARTLEEVGTARADMLIAVTGDDEDNLVACQVAKHKFNVPRTIARVKNPTHKVLFDKLGVNTTVSSTELILVHIGQELPSHPILPLLKLGEYGLEIVDIKISAGSKKVGCKIADLKLPPHSLIPLIIGKQKGAIIPTPNTVLEAGDAILAVTALGEEEALRTALAG